MNKQDAQIVSWLEEETDFEEAGAENLLEDVSESDRESEHSDHHFDTEQSAVESDKEVPSTYQASSVLAATPSQKSSRRGRGRGATVSQIPSCHDNYFTSIPLADELIANHRTTIVGTLRKNKRQIPPCFLITKDRDKPSTMFGFGEKKVLISYVPNKQQKKVVLLLSTLHDDNKIDETTGAAEKPEIITYYNGTKGGVDVVDQMKEEYSVGRMTRRWPMRLFFSVLNIAGINSQIIYKENTDHLLLRRFFLKQIALTLTRPHIIRRSEVNTLQKRLRNQIARFVPPEQQNIPSGREGICAVCPSKKIEGPKKGVIDVPSYCATNIVCSCVRTVLLKYIS